MGKFGWLVYASKDRSRRQLMISIAAVIVYLFGTSGLIYVIEQGSDGTLTDSSKRAESQWTYLNAVYFSAVTLCTVGYGDYVPTTPGGKVFVVFQTLFGIGIMAFALGTLSRHFVYIADKRIAEVYTRVKKSVLKSEEVPPKDDPSDLLFLIKKRLTDNRKVILAFAIYLIMVLIGAAIFNALESNYDGTPWGYGNSAYFCVVTLATIGYGDYAPRTEGGKVFLIFYIFLGFGILSFLLSELSKKVMRQITKKVENTARKTVELTDLNFEPEEIRLSVKVSKNPKTAAEVIDCLRNIVHKYKKEVEYDGAEYEKIHEELTNLAQEFDD